MTLSQYNEYFINTVVTDGLAISGCNAEYAPMRLQFFMGPTVMISIKLIYGQQVP